MLPRVTCPASRSAPSEVRTQTANGIAVPARDAFCSSLYTERNAEGEFSSVHVPRGGVGSQRESHSAFAHRIRDQARASERRYGRRVTPLDSSRSTTGQPSGRNGTPSFIDRTPPF